MQALLLCVLIFSIIHLAHSAILRTAMTNNYPQIAVLGCDSNKANLYYDIQRQVWVEHLVSSCVNDEQTILEFCQQAYPSLHIGNIVRLDTVLRFENWCQLMPSTDDNIPRCKAESETEEVVQPFRCLHMNSKREELSLPTNDCSMNTITGTGECLRAEKWQQQASLDCSNKTMLLNSSIMTLDWCGLAEFRGIQYICCPLKDIDAKNDYETSFDEQDDNTLDEDDPIKELIVVPKTSTSEPHRRIIAMSLGSNEPNWMDDYQRWNMDSGYFSNDEDADDAQEEIKLSSNQKFRLTSNEHERFTKDKEEFQRKYKEQIDQLKSRWQKRRNEIQLIANENPSKAQTEYENTEMNFRQEYDSLKQSASRERLRINELHENNLDRILDVAKNETNQKLIAAWNEKPLKTENIEEALYNYLHVLLRDRIHLVNRYERLRVVEPEQAERKRVSIHERLRSISNRINNALNQLRRYSQLQTKIQPRIDTLLTEYDQANQAADKLVIEYLSTLSTTIKNRPLPLGRDEKKIYPFPSPQPKSVDDNSNSEYEYDLNDDYEDDDDDDQSTTSEINNDQVDVENSDWDTDAALNDKIDSNNDEQITDEIRSFLPKDDLNPRRILRSSFLTYLPYIIGSLFVLCIMFGLLIFRFIIQQRRKHRYGGKFEKNYAFTEVNTGVSDEKPLHALQLNGYENPTYKFFENQTPKC